MSIELGPTRKGLDRPGGLLDVKTSIPPPTFDIGERKSPSAVSASAIPQVNLQAQTDLLKQQKKLIDTQLREAEQKLAGAKAVAPVGAAAAGLAAGGQVQPTTSSGSAVLQTAGAGLSGAAAGALAGSAGGPVGAAIGAGVGGLVGLVSGGLQSYIGLKEARKQRREIDAQNREVRKLNEQSRQDNLRQVAFNQQLASKQLGLAEQGQEFNQEQALLANRQAAINQRTQTMDKSRQLLNDLVAGNQQLKNVFIQQAR